MKNLRLTITFLIIFTVSIMTGARGWGAEPDIDDYTCYPIFQVNAVAPNILIMLDNSGSMNFYAYGTWPGNEQLVRDTPYAGEPYNGRIGKIVKESSDDAQEVSGDGTVTIDDQSLVIGVNGSDSMINGLRFTDIDIPQGAIINNAYIQFVAMYNDDSTASFTITGELSGNSGAFTETTNNISSTTARPVTGSSVDWDSESATPLTSWEIGETYKTPDLKSIVQEIANQSGTEGWVSGNAITFKIAGQAGNTGARTPYSFDYKTAYNDMLESSYAPMLYIEYDNPDGTDVEGATYYGYFNPDYFYYYNGTRFVHKYKKIGYDTSGGYWNAEDLTGTPVNLTDAMITSTTMPLWDGNWMNWVSMRRIDILRKVLMGGLMTSRTGGGNQTIKGETPKNVYNAAYARFFDSSLGSAVSPYDGPYYYGIKGGYIYHGVTDFADVFGHSADTTSLWISKDIHYEPEDFDINQYLAGVIDKIGADKARWGNMWFSDGETTSGGEIKNPIGTGLTDMENNLQNLAPEEWTPLAEAYYVAMQYFAQEDPESGLGYSNSAVPIGIGGVRDPYYDKDNAQMIECASSFVLILTDGVSSKDTMIPTDLKDFDGDGDLVYCDESDNDPACEFDSGGTDFLDDIALYARTTDLRPNLDGDQNLILYAVYGFGNDPKAEGMLKDAAKNGGYEDRDGTAGPTSQKEWDADLDGIPDTFYHAQDGYQLEHELLKAVNDILNRAAAGTAVSVLATSGEGEGTLVQAYFRPSVPIGETEITWVGYLQSLWVDSNGNLREDTNNNQKLDVASDNIINTYLDTSTGDTRVKVWRVSGTDPYPDTSLAPDEIKELDEMAAIWEAGSRLAECDASTRNIFTFIDRDGDGVVDESGTNLDDQGEIVEFSSATTNLQLITPYLGVKDDTAWSYLGSTHSDRAGNLIDYIRGIDDVTTLTRDRTIDYDEDLVDEVWKLGDIVYSSPVTVSKPPDNYHVIYGDQLYEEYYDDHKDRETVVYVGANDGMLHAFTSGAYNSTEKGFEEPDGDVTYGDELWAYIPQALLPHLKWLAEPDYTHVYYVDLKPKVFDAKIEDSWRTLLLVGLNLGGKYITSTGDFDYNTGTDDTTRDFYSSYTLIDITNPREPDVLWERSYDDLQLTTSFPAVVKVQDKWFAVFGSGPADCACTSSNYGHIYVVDLETGDPYQSSTGVDWLFKTYEDNAFMNSPVSVDKDLNFNVDAIYFGETYGSASSGWEGKLYKVAVPWVDDSGNYDDSTTDNYSDDPNGEIDPDKKWKLYPFLDATRPITSSVTLSIDVYDNLWVYVGSGRYLSESDKANYDQQYMFGLKDPFFNRKYQTSPTDYYHNYTNYKTLLISDLLNSDPYIIKEGGEVLQDTSDPLDGDPDTSFGDWNYLLSTARDEDGWVRSLTITGERIITRFSVLGGIVFTPSFVPTADLCEFGGDSYLYGQYYETGTAYYRAVFKEGKKDITYDGGIITTILDKTSIGAGMASGIGIHVGKEGSKGFIQTSTGTIIEESLETALTVKSGLRSWMEK